MDEVARAALFLASDESSFVTGAALRSTVAASPAEPHAWLASPPATSPPSTMRVLACHERSVVRREEREERGHLVGLTEPPQRHLGLVRDLHLVRVLGLLHGVMMKPGHTAFTRIVGASSSAIDRESSITPAFVAL